MTVAEAIKTLREDGAFTQAQAEALADVLEKRENERLVTRDFLDARLSDLKTDLLKWLGGILIAHAGIVLTGVYFLLTHYKA